MKKIKLTQGKETIVDNDVFSVVGHLRWCAMKSKNTFYAYHRVSAEGGGIGVKLHHCVLGRPLWGKQIDHVDGNGLNNARSNLRIVSVRENCLNRECHRSGRLAGAHPHSSGGFVSLIRLGGKTLYLGHFTNRESASRAYQEAIMCLREQWT